MNTVLIILLGLAVIAGVVIALSSKNDKKETKPTRVYPHYVTVPCTGLPLKGRLRITVNAVGPFPDDATLTPYFQRAGDDWMARGPTEAYRWWASFATTKLVPGEHVFEVPFDALWTAVLTSTRDTNPTGFLDALNNADKVGFTIGDVTGLGHGENPPGALANYKIEVLN